MRRMLTISVVIVAALMLFVGSWLVGRLGIGSVVDPASLNVAERQLVEQMRDVRLIGSFTTAGCQARTPAPDRYDISSVEKVGADLWRFNAKMDCCTVRLFFYGDRYAGTWQHGDTGGHMSGRIEERQSGATG